MLLDQMWLYVLFQTLFPVEYLMLVLVMVAETHWSRAMTWCDPFGLLLPFTLCLTMANVSQIGQVQMAMTIPEAVALHQSTATL